MKNCIHKAPRRPQHQAEDRIMLEGRCDCKAAVMGVGGGRFDVRLLQSRLGRAYGPSLNAGTPCRS